MGHEAGKLSWPRPAGGYQTITGRRYGRRHAYISFKPTSYKHRSLSNVERQEMEKNTVDQQHFCALSKGNPCSVLPAILPAPSCSLMHLQLTNQDDHNRQKSSSQKAMDVSLAGCEKRRSDPTVQVDADHNTRTEKCDSAWEVKYEMHQKLPSAGVLSFVNIDSYEPDSSGGEEEGLSSDQSCDVQKRLDLSCKHGKDVDFLGGSHSCALTEFCELSNRSAQEMNSKTDQDSAQSHRTRKTHGKNDLQSDMCSETTCSGDSHINLKCTSMKEAMQSEMVVRPKVRKQVNESHLDKRKYSQVGETSWIPSAKSVKSTCGSAPPFLLTQKQLETDFPLNIPPDESTSSMMEQAEQTSKLKVDDDDFWEDLEDFEKSASHGRGDESSDCSEGEWTASWTSDSWLEKEQRLSEESWETLPGLDELPSSSSLEDVPPVSLTQEEQTNLEEGEIPWLRCIEDSDSSSDENTDSMSQFVHPGLFILDSSNNLDDDSSMSEDLDTDWRLLDDFDEGFGMAQAISYVDHPQLLTYMALEERLAQAMEAALAHLESLAIDVEQAHPPASEHIIGCLPHILVLDEHRGQEQCCAICCCEYVTEEIATQLPCHHMFHKLCVTVWLRKSGTCPVCRYVLTPPLSEPTAFFPSSDNPSSAHSMAGQTR